MPVATWIVLFILVAVVAFYAVLLLVGIGLLTLGTTAGVVAARRRSTGQPVRPWLIALTVAPIVLALLPLAPSLWWFSNAALQTFGQGR